MQSNELVELAAAISTDGPALLATPGAVSASGMADYWAASKCRQQRWSCSLKETRQRSAKAPSDAPRWRTAAPLCREVLAGEILTRVCTGFWIAFDLCAETREAEPLARSVWIGHMESRRTVLNLLASGEGLPESEAESLDRLRRAAERWTDLLLAPFTSFGDVADLAHDAARMADFAQDAAEDGLTKSDGRSHYLWFRSRSEAFASCRRLATFNTDLNAEIAASILSCFHFDNLDEGTAPCVTAFSRSLLDHRLSTVADDAELWLAGLLA